MWKYSQPRSPFVRNSLLGIVLVVLFAMPVHTASASMEGLLDMQEIENVSESPAPLVARIFNIDPDDPPYLVVFLGRFHPLVVHLPIALLLLAYLLEVVRRREKFTHLASAVPFVLFWGAVSAVGAVGAGLLLSLSGEYSGDAVWWHKWLGIGVAVTAIAAYVMKRRTMPKDASPVMARSYTGLMVVSFLLLIVASHKGGELTHGEGYLTEYMPEPVRSWAGIPPLDDGQVNMALENVDEAHVFNDIVQPIFSARCESCHNPSKQRGDLLLTSAGNVQAGGESGPIFEAGSSANSDLFRRITLDSDHDDRMPPSGRRALSDDQIALIGWWIDSGASFENNVAATETPEEIRTILDGLASPDEGMMAADVDPADPTDIQALSDLNVLVTPLSSETNLLEAQFINARETFTDNEMNLLSPISDQLTWLNLANTQVTDAGLTVLTEMTELTRLHLEKTAVTDNGLAHIAGLNKLEYLNLYDTAVSDAGLVHLEGLTNLKSLYLWLSDVTPEGAAQLQAALPDLEINMGLELADVN